MICLNCEAKFSIQYNLNAHLDWCTKEQPLRDHLKCDNCDGKYFSRSELVSHKVEAHGWKPEIHTYKCRNGCGQYFEESEKRMRHEDNTCEAREANVERLWQCEEVMCGKAFQSAHLLYLHRHAVHVRGAEARGMLSEIGINTMPLDGSAVVRAKFRANTRLYIYIRGPFAATEILPD